MSLSIGIFFSLMIAGLAKTLPGTLSTGLQQQGVSMAEAHRIAELPPVGSLFAAFLGYNPIGELMGDTVHQPGVNASVLTGKEFFPHLISGPFHAGLTVVFIAAAVMMVIGGGRVVGESGPGCRPRLAAAQPIAERAAETGGISRQTEPAAAVHVQRRHRCGCLRSYLALVVGERGFFPASCG